MFSVQSLCTQISCTRTEDIDEYQPISISINFPHNSTPQFVGEADASPTTIACIAERTTFYSHAQARVGTTIPTSRFDIPASAS